MRSSHPRRSWAVRAPIDGRCISGCRFVRTTPMEGGPASEMLSASEIVRHCRTERAGRTRVRPAPKDEATKGDGLR